MCGIVGILGKDLASSEKAMQQMLQMQKHRGPDAQGLWQDAHCTLGHNRLAIIDLQDAANQPMHSINGRFTIVFNGEIYNYRDIKKELSKTLVHWKTDSDTEVLLEAYAKWGPDCLKKLNGMFGFAIWDNKDNSLFLARDRMGIKPVYYSQKNETFLFASELRVILKSGLVSKDINSNSVADFIRYSWVQAPDTIMQDVHLLEQGTYAVFKNGVLTKTQWWDINAYKYTAIEKGESIEHIRTNVKELFYKAVDARLVSDLPIGAFLSGGIDSSAVVAAMAEQSTSKVNTFSIGFKEKEYDESDYARAISKKFNTEHHSLICSAESTKNEIPEILNSFDTPSADGVNSYIISSLVKQSGITVALSGLGGDELFCGYPVFKQLPKLANYESYWKLPHILRKQASAVLALPQNPKLSKLSEMLQTESFSNATIYPFFRQIYSKEMAKKVLNANSAESRIKDSFKKVCGEYTLGWISHAEITGYTQNVLLKDADMCSMTHALEIRVPFFDHNLVEYVLQLSDKAKQPLSPKKLFIDALSNELPDEVVNRKKMGFAFPWDVWLRKDLKSFVDTTLSYADDFDFFNPSAIQNLWKRYLANDKSIKWYQIWNLVCIIHWLRTNIST